MEPTNQPSPYFVRRTPRPVGETIDIHDYAVVEDQVHPLRDYWLIAKRHRWLILSCALVSFIGAALYTFTRTPLYTSEATLLIERKAPQILKLQDAHSEAADYSDYNNEFYKTQYEILRSRDLAERVVRDEGLENHPLFGGGKMAAATKEGMVSGLWKELKNSAQSVMPAKPQPTTPNIQDSIPLSTRLAGLYQSMVQVRPVAGTSLVTIKITTTDPALSARLADAHASSYVRYGIDLRSQTNNEAGEFLQQKLVELKERIEQSEAALNKYRKEKGIISVDDKSNVIIERLLDLNKGLTAAEGERIGWEAQVRAARGRSAEEVPSVRNSAVIGPLKAELGKFEAEYASLAKEFKAGYPPLDNLRARIEETRRRVSAEIDREVKSIEAAYAAASNKESQLRAAMDEQKRTTLDLKDSAVQYAILAREVDTNKQLYDGVLSRLKEIGVAAEVRSSNIHVMGKALPPGGPSYPDNRRTMMLGLLFGLAAGIGLAFLLEQLDNTLKTPEEAERYLRLASLGMIPDFAAVNGKRNGFVSKLLQSAHAELPGSSRKADKESPSGVLLDHDPLSVVSEAYRSFRSALLLSQAGGPPHTMLVTSAGRGDGKTTTLVNTAIVFAQLGIRVLIIDADLRRPQCHVLLRLENKAGLSDLLAGQLELATAIRATPAENLFLISAGAVPPNPAELLGSRKMHELLEQLCQQFEFVFIDSSPVLAVTDSVFLSTMVDGTLLVVNSRTPKPLVKKARARLALSHSKILGMLLNRVDIHNNEYGGYYQQYYSYYGHDDSPALANGGAPKFVGNGNGTPQHASEGDSPDTQEPTVRAKPGNGLAAKSLDDLGAKGTKAIGPMAPFVLREEMVALGESPDSFPESRLEELTKRVSREIADHKLRPPVEQEVLEDAKIETENGAHHAAGPAAAASAISEKTKETGLPAPVKPAEAISNPAIKKEPDKGLPAEFLAAVGDKLLRAMGPMAPIVLREHLRALGGSAGSFPKAKLEELAKELGKEVSDDYHRQRFEKELAEEIRKLDSQANGGPSDTYIATGNGTPKASAKKELHNTQEFLSVMSAKLTDAIGPIAPLILRERIVALGESAETFNEAKVEELAKELSREISDDYRRQRFEKELAEELQKLGLQANGRISDEKNGTKAATKKEVDDTQEFLSIISANLSDAIGPIAPLVLRDRIVALGESAEAFPRARIEEIIVDLSIEISYEPIRRQFQKEMARQIQKLKKQGAWGYGEQEAKGKPRRGLDR